MNFIFRVAFLFTVSIGTSFAQTTIYVAPIETHPDYAANQDSHLVVPPNTSALNKLFVFFGGTGSETKNLELISNLASNLGYHVINLSYPNSVPAGSCNNSTDILCFDHFRQEVFFGTPVSNNVEIDTLNSITSRLNYLLDYLSLTYPSDNWNQFYEQNTILWEKIAVGGHSQGAGHAAYCAKNNTVDRVLLFSGPNDYSSYFEASGNWISSSSLTPIEKYFSFLHLYDEVVDFTEQYQILSDLNMTALKDTLLIDNLLPPFSNSNCLYTKSDAQPPQINRFHGATVVDKRTPLDVNNSPKFLPVWDYMLTSTSTLNLDNLNHSTSLIAFPNPTKGLVQLQTEETVLEYFLLDQEMKILQATTLKNNSIDLSHLPNSTYFLYFKEKTGKWKSIKVTKTN